MKRLALALFLISGCAHQQAAPVAAADVKVDPATKPMSLPELIQSMVEQQEEPVAHQDSSCAKPNCLPVYKLHDELTPELLRDLYKWMGETQKAGAKRVLLDIDSPGGDVEPGMELLAYMDTINLEVDCFMNRAYSMAATLSQGCQKRFILRDGNLMFHTVEQTKRISGRITEWENAVEELRVMDESIAVRSSKRLHISLDAYKARVAGAAEFWLTAPEAVAVGAADVVVTDIRAVYEALGAKE